MDYPDYFPFLEGSPRRDLRQALLERFANRATDQNRPLLEEALGLRRRKAALLGYPSWADYRMEPNMAGSPDRVVALHDGVVPVLQALATDEYAEMARRLQADEGTSDLRSWDVSYYDKRILADEFGVDADEVSTYLPLDAAFDGLLALTAEVFDLAFVESAEPGAWHADVRRLDVRDGTSGEHLGWCYADLHPRPGKFGHAMAWPIRLARVAEDGSRVGGVSAIVMNVPRGTSDAPALLRHDDVETLFHEFGHVLHEVLGRNAYFRTSMWGVEEDFGEAISQIMENWAWDARILRRFARHHQTGAPLPEALARRIEGSRNVDLGSNYLRTFIGYGDLDLRLHGPDPVDIEVAMRAADATRLLPTVEGAFWPASFGHIMAGYDAGYYGYLLVARLWRRPVEPVRGRGHHGPDRRCRLPARPARVRRDARRRGDGRVVPRAAVVQRGVPAAAAARPAGGRLVSVFTAAEIAYLEAHTLGRLATVGGDGRPHVVPVSYRFNRDEDAIDIGGIDFGASKSWRDANHDRRVTFLVDDAAPKEAHAIEIRGDAEIHTTGGEGINPRFPMFKPEFIRIRPWRIVELVDRGARARTERSDGRLTARIRRCWTSPTG